MNGINVNITKEVCVPGKLNQVLVETIPQVDIARPAIEGELTVMEVMFRPCGPRLSMTLQSQAHHGEA